MPSFLLKRENQVDVLIVFFVILLVIAPVIIMIWYNRANKYDSYGIETKNQMYYYHFFQNDIAESYLPYWIISSAHEFNKITADASDEKYF